jgi:hypothetical protein
LLCDGLSGGDWIVLLVGLEHLTRDTPMTAETENGSKVWIPAWFWTAGVVTVVIALTGIVWGSVQRAVTDNTAAVNSHAVTLNAHELRLDWNDRQHAAQQILNERILEKVDQILEEVRAKP